MGIEILPLPESGIPTGATGDRPASPSIGDVFYNGTTENLEIYNGTGWVAASAPASMPSIAVTDVGTNIPYGSAQASVTFTESSVGGKALGFTVNSSAGGYTATSTSNPVVITVGNNGNWTFTGTAYNDYGVSPSSASSSVALTTVPQAPTIGTATTSSGTTTVGVTWTLGNNGGKNLTSITIIPYLNGITAQTPTTAATTNATSVNITGLTMGSSYTFKVKATNANGDSIESNATNSVTIPTVVTVNYLVIGGGGGGAQGSSAGANSGGGGAGGYRTSAGTSGGSSSAESPLGISPGVNLTVTVGAGGNGIVPADVNQNSGANSGSASQFYNINSSGGGGGGVGNIPSQSGGSGGGGGGSGGAPGIAGQGSQGGGNGGKGGGGGAANAGSEDSGGNGLLSNITGNAVTRAGGGGGWYFNGGTGGTGGPGASGQANTGSGGSGYINGTPGGSGGSGIVVIVYPSNYTLGGGTGLTSTTNTSGNNKITTFNAGTGTVNF